MSGLPPYPDTRSTALALRPVNYGALATTSLARFGEPRDEGLDLLSWSLTGLERFSLTPTILQALNRLRVLSGLEPLRMRPDGTLDFYDDPLQFQFGEEHAPFAE